MTYPYGRVFTGELPAFSSVSRFSPTRSVQFNNRFVSDKQGNSSSFANTEVEPAIKALAVARA